MTDTSRKNVYISQGEFAVGDQPGDVITTILGSCVATCLWDPVAKIGGMNHFLLPDSGASNTDTTRFGAYAMELLINGIIRKGGDRRRFRAKVFGGANLRAGLTNAGNLNAEYVMEYLERENIPCDGSSLGGQKARRLEFWPEEGRARQKFVNDAPMEKAPEKEIVPASSGIELF